MFNVGGNDHPYGNTTSFIVDDDCYPPCSFQAHHLVPESNIEGFRDEQCNTSRGVDNLFALPILRGACNCGWYELDMVLFGDQGRLAM